MVVSFSCILSRIPQLSFKKSSSKNPLLIFFGTIHFISKIIYNFALKIGIV